MCTFPLPKFIKINVIRGNVINLIKRGIFFKRWSCPRKLILRKVISEAIPEKPWRELSIGDPYLGRIFFLLKVAWTLDRREGGNGGV